MLKSRHADSYREAVTKGHEFFAARGFTPAYEWLDNETSTQLEHHFDEWQIQVNYVPPNSHRANRAERAIQTAKNHFIAGLASVDPDFPPDVWDELLPQGEITLNLLRMSRITPNISAYQQVCGAYDFQKHPMAPPGIKIAVLIDPDTRAAFQEHAEAGFYLGPALQHYRSYRVWVTSTQSVRISDSLDWFPKDVVMPGASPIEQLTATMHDMRSALTRYIQAGTLSTARQPLNTEEATTRAQLQRVMDAFTQEEPAPEAVPANPNVQRVVDAATPPGLPPPIHRYARTQFAPVNTRAQTRAALLQHAEGPRNIAPARRDSSRAAPADSEGAEPTEPIPKQQYERTPRQTTGAFNQYAAEKKRTARQRQNARRRANAQAANAALRTEAYTATRTAYFTAHAVCAHMQTPQAIGTWFQHFQKETRATAHEKGQWGGKAAHHYTQSTPNTHGEQVASSATDDITGKPLRFRALRKGPEADIWEQASREEFIRLMRETKTMSPCHPSEVPEGQKTSYYNQVCSIKIKEGRRVARVRGTFGGEVIDYDGETTALTAALPTIKLLANDIISDPTAKALVVDIKDFYLMSDLLRPEFMWINLADMPDDIQAEFDTARYAVAGRVLMKVVKGIYGLPQAGFLAQQALAIHLAEYGYEEAADTPCLFTHPKLGTKFTLVVDDFLIKYKNAEAARHIVAALKAKYTITEDYTASKYIGIAMHWHYTGDRRVEMDMATATQKALARFNVIKNPAKDTLAPNKFIQPIYASGRQQQTDEPDTSPPLNAAETTELQAMIGCFQYLARAVDGTQLVKLGQLASEQSRATQAIKKDTELFLQYVATWPAATITMRPSDMLLKIHSDASYLSEPRAGSRVGGYFYLGNHHDERLNGAIHVLSVRLDVVVASAAEAEYGGIFHNAKEGVALRNTLADLGHHQPPTTIVTDNQVACNLANDKVKQRRSKAIDMRYHWIRDRIRQQQFNVIWQPGSTNLADFFTKLHPPRYHRETRKLYVTDPPRQLGKLQQQQIPMQQKSVPPLANLKRTGEGVLIVPPPVAASSSAAATHQQQQRQVQPPERVDSKTTERRPCTLQIPRTHNNIYNALLEVE
jgi:hypothetical protein